MSNNIIYQNISCPFGLDFESMTQNTRDRYAKWFLECIPLRIAILTRHINNLVDKNWEPNYSAQSFLSIERVLRQEVSFVPFSDHEWQTLYGSVPSWIQDITPRVKPTHEYWSLCVDSGIYMAESLRQSCNDIIWTQCIKNNSVDYNRMVLVGFKSHEQFEPIRIGLVSGLNVRDNMCTRGWLTERFVLWKNKGY